MRTLLHVDFNSYFATVEQQANPRLRGKPIGVTGGDRTKRTVVGAASIEAKKFGVKTGMQLWEAQRLCPQIILVPGDSDKYLECTKRFLNILKRYSPYLEVFSIDEVFLELEDSKSHRFARVITSQSNLYFDSVTPHDSLPPEKWCSAHEMAQEIKQRIRSEIGEWITCSIGISYNKLMAKLAGSLKKPDGLIIIPDEQTAMETLNKVPLDEICGIGSRIKSRLNKMGVFNFKQLRQVPKEILLFEFKSYGQFLYGAARGIDERPIMPFHEKEEVKSVGHRHTIFHDTDDIIEIKQLLLKLTELVARKLRAKKLVGKTVSCWFRYALEYPPVIARSEATWQSRPHFTGDGMQNTILHTDDGLEIFNAAWKIFHQIWNGGKVRMVGVSISNLKPARPENLNFLDSYLQKETITKALDKINNKYGEFTLQRGILLGTTKIKRMPNSFLADRRFKI